LGERGCNIKKKIVARRGNKAGNFRSKRSSVKPQPVKGKSERRKTLKRSCVQEWGFNPKRGDHQKGG